MRLFSDYYSLFCISYELNYRNNFLDFFLTISLIILGVSILLNTSCSIYHNDRLNSILLLYIEQEVLSKIDTPKMIDDFLRKKCRKLFTVNGLIDQ